MGEPRDTYKYEVKVGRKVVHIGYTTDLKRRELEHKQEFPRSRIVRIGRATTQDAALRWEREKLDKVRIEPKELRNLSQNIRLKLSKHKKGILKILDEQA